MIDFSNWPLAYLCLKGEFYSTKMHTEPPFEPQPFMVPEPTGYMLSLGFSEFTLNSASFGYYSAGLLQLIVNDSMVRAPEKKPESPGQLFKITTRTFRRFGFAIGSGIDSFLPQTCLWLRDVVLSPQIPSLSPVRLNTSSMGSFIPQVSLSHASRHRFHIHKLGEGQDVFPKNAKCTTGPGPTLWAFRNVKTLQMR